LGFGSATRVTPIPIDLPPQTQAHLRDYDAAVTALKTFYFKEDAVGKDWQAIAAQNREKIAAGVEDAEFVQLLRATIDAIKDEDIALLPPEQPVAATAPLTATYSGIGVVVGLPEEGKDRILALYVYPDSPADRAGIQAHDSIIKIDGDAVIFAEANQVVAKLRGEVGSKVILTVRTPGTAERDVTVTRRPVRPDSPLVYRILDGTNVGYIAPDPLNLREMKSDTANAMRALLNEGEIAGLVLDLRVVRGSDFPINDMLGLFVNGQVANVQLRTTKNKLEITGKSIAGSQDVPMVILVSNQTIGQVEAFAGILQSLGRARVVGEPTKGRVAVLNTVNLPSTGVRVQIPSGEYLSLKDASWYQKGVQPDKATEKTWEEVTTEDDAQLDQAVDLLLGR
jgi:carboxyl-terminal processing protease